ncbi:MAG: pilin [bacterium]|nr:pilin [bacterium]
MFPHLNKYIFIGVLALFLLGGIIFPQTYTYGQTSPDSDTPSSGTLGSGPVGIDIKLDIKNPLGSIDSFKALAEAIFRAIVIIAIPLTVIFLIWAGVLFVTARGNETQLAKAKKVFFWSVIGAMVIVASWVIAVALNNSLQNL